MSGISSRMDAIRLINSDEQTPDDEDARFELRCAACGYGAVARIAPEACPVCRGTVWEHVPSHRTDEVFTANPIQRTLIEHVSSATSAHARVTIAQPSRPNTELSGHPPARTCTRNDRPT